MPLWARSVTHGRALPRLTPHATAHTPWSGSQYHQRLSSAATATVRRRQYLLVSFAAHRSPAYAPRLDVTPGRQPQIRPCLWWASSDPVEPGIGGREVLQPRCGLGCPSGLVAVQSLSTVHPGQPHAAVGGGAPRSGPTARFRRLWARIFASGAGHVSGPGLGRTLESSSAIASTSRPTCHGGTERLETFDEHGVLVGADTDRRGAPLANSAGMSKLHMGQRAVRLHAVDLASPGRAAITSRRPSSYPCEPSARGSRPSRAAEPLS